MSSVALAREGRQGNLDAFVAAGAARRAGGAGGGFRGGGGDVEASLTASQPSSTSVVTKRKAETSIQSFFKPKGARGSAADSRAPLAPRWPPAPDPPVATVTASRETVEAWRRIQLRQQPPKCRGHGETCKIRTVKKAGENFGRVFFACPRPAGSRAAGGDCGFFQWAYDRR